MIEADKSDKVSPCPSVALSLVILEIHSFNTIKDRNKMDLKETEDIKKWWQEYTEELYKKDFHDPDNHDGVITDLEPDILACEVKWALESITRTKWR